MLRDLPDNFQLEQLRAALEFCDNFDVAIDVGAHRGIWTFELLKRFTNVVAIEPTDLNKKIDPRAQVIKCAAGREAGYCSMKAGENNNGQSYVIQGGDIEVITIDSLMIAPNFIKIDVEGMEPDVLMGARKTIKDYSPLIMIEENGLCQRYGHYQHRATRILNKWGYREVATFHMMPEKDKNIVFKKHKNCP